MSSKDSGEPRLQIHQIAILVAAVTGGVWLYQGPLKSSRPAQDIENKSIVATAEERVQARLWQDPFEAVEAHIKSEESKTSKQSESGETTHSHSLRLVATEVATSTPPPSDIQVLVILTDGSPYADNRESRLRQRFAVLAGLDQAGYAPRDSEHIRFFYWPEEDICQDISSYHQGKTSLQVNWSGSTEDVQTSISFTPKSSCARTHDQAGKHEYWRHTPVPVDWYQLRESPPGEKSHVKSDVLVFWINDQDLGNRPTESLRAIQRMTRAAFTFIPWHPTVSVTVIGPRFSGTLQIMTPPDKRLWTPYIALDFTEKISPDLLTIYSPWSTAPAQYLIGLDPHRLPPLYPVPHANQLLRERFADGNIEFIRTIPTDEQLIDTLFDELARRGVSLKCNSMKTCNHIAIISEWDTLYGRTLPALAKKRILRAPLLTEF